MSRPSHIFWTRPLLRIRGPLLPFSPFAPSLISNSGTSASSSQDPGAGASPSLQSSSAKKKEPPRVQAKKRRKSLSMKGEGGESGKAVCRSIVTSSSSDIQSSCSSHGLVVPAVKPAPIAVKSCVISPTTNTTRPGGREVQIAARPKKGAATRRSSRATRGKRRVRLFRLCIRV